MIGLVWVDTAATFDGGRWRLAQQVQADGYAPSTIDAGLEWFAYHQNGVAEQRPTIANRGFWVSLFGRRPVCVTISLPGSDGSLSSGAGSAGDTVGRLTVHSLAGLDYRFVATAGPQQCTPKRTTS